MREREDLHGKLAQNNATGATYADFIRAEKMRKKRSGGMIFCYYQVEGNQPRWIPKELAKTYVAKVRRRGYL